MTTAQHSSYMNANLPNLKAQTSEMMMGEGVSMALGSSAKDDQQQRDHLVPSEKELPAAQHQAVPSSVVGGAPQSSGGEGAGATAAAAAAGAATAGADGGTPLGEWEKRVLDIGEISVEHTGDVLVKVPADLVGRMIGKHGTVIKELQLQSGAFINMAKDGEVFRLARITGGHAEARLCACLLVEKFTPAESTEKRARLESLIAYYRVAANRPQRAYLVETVSLTPDMVSRLVGRGGLLLRELQDKTRAKIDLPRSTGGDEHRKVVTLSGTTAEVTACRDMIRSLMHEPMQAPMYDEYYGNPYDQHAVPSRPYYAQPYPTGYPQYMPSHHQGGYADPYAQPYPMRGYYYPEQAVPDMARLSLEADDHVVPTPHSHHMYGAPAPMAPLMAAAAISSPPHMHAYGQQQQQQQQPPTPTLSSPGLMMPSTTYAPPPVESIVAIPGDMVGRLIGRQGVAVKQLQSETHTRIDILDPAPHTGYTVRHVRITGPKAENVQQCMQMIQSRVTSFWNNPPASPASSHSGQH